MTQSSQPVPAVSSSPAATPPAKPAKIRVAVIEDTPNMRQTLQRLLNESAGYECIAAYSSAESALETLAASKPEVVLTDVNLPGLDGIECVRRLKPKLPGTIFIMLTVHENTDRIFQAVQAGASGYLLKRSSPSDILNAIQDARNGGAPMTNIVARKVLDAFRNQLPVAKEKPETVELSDREREVLEKLAKGYFVKEIADQLGVSFWTVRTYIMRIYEKLHVRSRSEATAHYFATRR